MLTGDSKVLLHPDTESIVNEVELLAEAHGLTQDQMLLLEQKIVVRCCLLHTRSSCCLAHILGEKKSAIMKYLSFYLL